MRKDRYLSQELKRYTSDPANYDETISIGSAETVKGSNKKNQVAKERMMKN